MPASQYPKLTLTHEELEKVAKAKARGESVKVDENWLFIAEFGYYYGWEGVQAILDNKITLDTANVLLHGAIKVWCGKLVQEAQVIRVATAAANSKRGKQVMNTGLKEFIKTSKVDE